MIKFSDLNLNPKVLSAIAEAGYETPTPIQAGAIPPALEGKDVLGIAQTGTGKTASFTLPMITLLARGRARARMPRSLVLCPTRELAAQVAENFDIYAKNTKLTKALLIGGVSFGEQDKLIDRGVDVLIATPGRLLDHFERGKLLLTGVQIMVVDEADRMLDMGFIPDIERIFQMTPFTRQTLFFSATMAPEIERITNTFLHAPARIEVARQATTSENITQKLIELTASRRDTAAKQKRDLLRKLIEQEGDTCTNAIIFCNRKMDVDVVAKSLKTHGYDAAPIHGDLDQSQRTRTLDGFREGSLRFLVASDVAARGLDVPSVSHVFNFDVPSHAEDYVHRIGRTGRAGRKGFAFTLSTPADAKYLAAIEELVKQPIPRGELPEGFSTLERPAPARTPRDDAEERPKAGDRGEGRSRTRGGRSRNRRDESEAVAATDETAVTTAQDAAPATEATPTAEAAEAAPKRTRSRRSRGGRSSSEAKAAEVAEVSAAATQEAPAAERETNARDTRRDHGTRENNNRDAGPRETGNRETGNRDTGNRESGNRDNNRGHRDNGRAVVGMGEHVPDFILRPFVPKFTKEDETSDS
jgi:superfamily II DNA/RNA helicase